MPNDPKPLAGYGTHLSYCLNASTSIVPVDEWKLAVAELNILRADAEAYRLLKTKGLDDGTNHERNDMGDKRLEVKEIVSVLKELECHAWRDVRFCLFSDGTGRIDQGGQSKAIESWGAISELIDRMRCMDRQSKRDRVFREAMIFGGGDVHPAALREAVAAVTELESPIVKGT